MPGKKGIPQVRVTDAADKDLTYWTGRISQTLEDGDSRYPERDGAILAAMRAEIARRNGPDPRQQDLGNGSAQSRGYQGDEDDIPLLRCTMEQSIKEPAVEGDSNLALLESLVLAKSLGPALIAYYGASTKAAVLRADADEAFARAILVTDGKNEAIRKAAAEVTAAPYLLAAKLAEANASALRHLVIHLRGDGGRGGDGGSLN